MFNLSKEKSPDVKSIRHILLQNIRKNCNACKEAKAEI